MLAVGVLETAASGSLRGPHGPCRLGPIVGDEGADSGGGGHCEGVGVTVNGDDHPGGNAGGKGCHADAGCARGCGSGPARGC